MERDMENRIRRARAEEEGASEQMTDRMILLSRMQWNAANLKKRIGFGELLLSQLRYIGWRMWMVELILAFVPTFLIIQYVEWHVITPVKAVCFLSCLVVGISMFWVVFIYRSGYYHMMEIEAAAFFSLKRLLLSRIIILFAGELAVIAGISALTSAHTALGFGSGMVYMLFAFGACSNGMLVLIRRAGMDRLCRYFLAYGVLLLAVLLLLAKFLPQFFDGTRQTWVAFGSFVLLGYCIYQGVLLLKQHGETVYA